MFTFGAVPSAIVHANAEPVYVNTNRGYTINVDHLAEIAPTCGAKFCVVSHMRGKAPLLFLALFATNCIGIRVGVICFCISWLRFAHFIASEEVFFRIM